MRKIGIVDYSIGNLFSVFQACKEVGFKPELLSEASEVKAIDGVILPGVGAFGKGIQNLKDRGLDLALKEHIAAGKPFMGICLGMQLLLDKSEEFGGANGLGLIKGEVRSFKGNIREHLPVPKISWDTNIKEHQDWGKSPFKDLSESDDVYFVHSFYCDVRDSKDVLARSEYGGIKYCSAILRDNIFATQFHPEKSGKAGLKIYINWKNVCFV